ncbi:uncharacterized protein LOC143722247 [Siphateles boraxobius]|uniref:uncharacterized protein LOC143722247 n=1 Tax=Siphateles boraxobius TaxID=180520 RepID=UPI004062DE11
MAPSSSVLASLPLPLNEQYAGSLTSLQGSSGSAATDTTSVSTHGESTSFPAILGSSGLATSDQSSPSLYMSSSLETSGATSEATLPAFSQESISYSSSSSPGATYTSQGSPVLASEGSGQSVSPQGEGSYSGLSQSQGASNQYNPGSYNALSSSSVSSQSTSDQSTPSLYSSSFQGSSGSLLEASGSFQGEVAGLSSLVDLSPQSQDHSSQLLPSPLEVSSQSTNGQSTPSLLMVGSESSSDSQSTGPASPLDTRGNLSQSISSQSTSVQSSLGVSTSTQSSSGTPLTSSNFFPVQGGSSSTSSLYLKPQGSLSLYAPASRTKYVSFPVSSHPAVYSQSKSSSGALFGGSTGFSSQGMSSTYSGSVQPQGTTSQFAFGSPSSYPSVSLSSPQGASSQSATIQSSRKQFTSSYGAQSGSSKPFTLQGSTTYGGSLQPQDTTRQFASGSLSSHPSVPLFSSQHPASQSATVQSSRKQFTFTGNSGTWEGPSAPFSLQGSTTYGGSLWPQDTTSQFASGSPSSYPSVPLFSSQHPASQSATVQGSRKQFTFTGNSGTQEGPSAPFSLQGSTTYGGSLWPQDTTRQFSSGSPSSYPSVALSSSQGAIQTTKPQSAILRKGLRDSIKQPHYAK